MAKEKPLHMRTLEQKLDFLKNYVVPGKKGYKEISDTQTILPDEIKASINNYLVNKKAGLGHGKNEENGLPKKYSLGDNEELRHAHARNILVQVARAIYARKTSVEAAKEIKDDEMLLTFLDEYLRPLGTTSHMLATELAEKSYENIYKNDKLASLITRAGDMVAQAKLSSLRGHITENPAYADKIETRAKSMHPSHVKWRKHLEPLDYLTHIEAGMAGTATTPAFVDSHKHHFHKKSVDKLIDEYQKYK